MKEIEEMQEKIKHNETVLDFIRLTDFYLLKIKEIDKCIEKIKIPGILSDGLKEIEIRPVWGNEFTPLSLPNNILILLLIEAKSEYLKKIDQVNKEWADFKLKTGI